LAAAIGLLDQDRRPRPTGPPLHRPLRSRGLSCSWFPPVRVTRHIVP
jgi:hypothetical protein